MSCDTSNHKHINLGINKTSVKWVLFNGVLENPKKGMVTLFYYFIFAPNKDASFVSKFVFMDYQCVSGRPAALYDETNPDWGPMILLGYKSPQVTGDRLTD